MSTRNQLPNPLEELTLPQLRERTSMKWRTHPSDVLPLWVAEMDTRMAAPIRRALEAALAAGDTGYAAGTSYAEAVQSFAHRRWGWDGIAVERTAIVPDVMMGVVEMLRLVSSDGDAVVVNSPVYPPFYSFVEHMNRRIVDAPLDGDGRIDFDTLEATFARVTAGNSRAVYLLSSPHNPTGTVHTAEELSRVAALADRFGVRVVVDEIHAPVVLPGATFVPYLSVPSSDNALCVMSASKGWNLAGLKAALAIAGPAAAGDLARLPEEVSHGPSHLGVIAHAAAFREGSDWLDALITGLDENRRILGKLLAEHLPPVRFTPPQGTYLAWLDCRGLGLDDESEAPVQRGLVTLSAGPAAVFLTQARVALSAGPAFGAGGDGHVRLNFATNEKILTEAVERMGAAWREHH
ncbi:MalY/PatB family protein [Rhodococcus opacus]|uniref:MalY/PatB family protein n=1 Tax=Rhodococcus opacus TaxID=37919 RepID=UPI002235C3F0|nr:aminotransferase class I/II-fold pyridoxal phosphate-dependent enzyme [Rhodococcus opacus]UZG60241.1 aminotransferase class I/II-fold pyridoxal phosphate-dependent enzyme [Rhodococcus opacus]